MKFSRKSKAPWLELTIASETPAGRDLPPGYQWQEFRPDLLPALIEIERSGTQFLAENGFPSLGELPEKLPETYHRELEEREILIVTAPDKEPCAFAIVSDLLLGDSVIFWIHEMTVERTHMRKGIGSALVKAAFKRARWAYHNAIGLTTFRNLPFNEGFYRRHGFTLIETGAEDETAESLGLHRQRLSETPPGIHPSTRAVMIRKL